MIGEVDNLLLALVLLAGPIFLVLVLIFWRAVAIHAQLRAIQEQLQINGREATQLRTKIIKTIKESSDD